MSAQEARRARRDPYLCLAYVSELSGGSRREGVARAVDISPTGIGLLLATTMPIGAEVDVQLLVLGTLCLRAAGTVVHSTLLDDDRYRVGVRFARAPSLTEVTKNEET